MKNGKFAISSKPLENTEATGLITYPIKPGDPLSLVIGKLQHEYGTATNIKSSATVNAVRTAITTALYKVKLYKQTPENGLIIYAGNAYYNGRGES